MSKPVDMALYEKFKKLILEMSPAIQNYQGTTMVRDNSCLSDREIADRLGLDVQDVTEIRCIAEVETIPLDIWNASDKWKLDKHDQAFRSRR